MQKKIINNYELGALGEQLVKEFFESTGSIVEQSPNRYDEEKDLLVDGVPTEVKTQTIYRNFAFPTGIAPALTAPLKTDTNIYRNQLCKCVNVDRLIFVTRPSRYDYVLRILEHPKPRMFTLKQNSHDNRFVAGFRLSDMKILKEFRNKDLLQIFEEL